MIHLKPTWPGAKYADHQEFGIRWMLDQEINGCDINGTLVHGGILGDEMGLGKTIQSLALIVNGSDKNTLIITPLAVRKQWEEAASRCDLNIFTAEKGEWKKQGKTRLRKSVYIAHYDKLVSELTLFQDMNFDRIILDEAHRIRNTKTVTAVNLSKIKASHCWALTATPIVNELDDAVAYLKFIGCPVNESGGWRAEYNGLRWSILLALLINAKLPRVSRCHLNQ